MRDFDTLLQEAVRQHGHLCAGQVLGVRMAQCGLGALDVDVEREPKRIVVFVEIDRCAADAVASVAGVSLGKRTLKYADYGKMAATFVDLKTHRAVRVAALDSARERAADYAPHNLEKHEAQMIAYRQMPERELFNVRAVRVELSEFDLPGHPRRRVVCARCGEGINDGRDVAQAGETLCRTCAGTAYYASAEEAPDADAVPEWERVAA